MPKMPLLPPSHTSSLPESNSPAPEPLILPKVSSAWLKIPNNNWASMQECRMQGQGGSQLTPCHFHPSILPPSSSRPKVRITTFSTPHHNRHRTIVGNRKKSRKATTHLARIVHCSPLSCKRFQKRKIQLKSFLSFHFLATFCVCCCS